MVWLFAPLAQSSVAAIPGLLWVLLAVDLALILLHAALGLAEDRGLIAQHPPLFDLNRDFAVPESWGYLKWLVGAGICLAAAGGRRLAALWPPAVIFLILLADDSGQVHERLGKVIANWSGLKAAFGLTPKDIGEVVAFSAMAFLLAVCLGLTGLLLRRTAAGRRLPAIAILGRLTALMALLALFGVGVDLAHIAVPPLVPPALYGEVNKGLGLIEDGGELVIGSVLVAFVLALRRGLSQ